MESIKKCTQIMNNGVIEQTAYIRAAAEKKDLDLSKFKDDIRRELNSPQPSGSGKLGAMFTIPIEIYVHFDGILNSDKWFSLMQ